jgi:hypothetical protein
VPQSANGVDGRLSFHATPTRTVPGGDIAVPHRTPNTRLHPAERPRTPAYAQADRQLTD